MIRKKLLACCPIREIAAKNELRAAAAAAAAATAAADVGVEVIVPSMGGTKD